jgi:hypothetical protein
LIVILGGSSVGALKTLKFRVLPKGEIFHIQNPMLGWLTSLPTVTTRE